MGNLLNDKPHYPPSTLKKVADYTKFEFKTTEQVPKLTNIVGHNLGWKNKSKMGKWANEQINASCKFHIVY